MEAGWYDDPDDADRQRWWDGQQWTAHVQQDPAGDDGAVAAPARAGRGPRSAGAAIGGLVLIAAVALGWWAGSTRSEPPGQQPGGMASPESRETADEPLKDFRTGQTTGAEDSRVSLQDLQQLTWHRQINADRSSGARMGHYLLDAASHGSTVVAVGVGNEGGLVWTSQDDGESWELVPHDDEVFGRPGRRGQMRSVVAGDAGFVAVGGYDGASGHPTHSMAWTSTDGMTWDAVTVEPHDAEAIHGMHSVVEAGPGFVAVGSGTRGAVWTSTDGTDWQQVPHEAVGGGTRYHALRAVTTWGSGLVAVGRYGGDPSFGWPPVVWASPDGLAWEARVLEDLSRDGFGSIVAGGPGLVATGRVGGGWPTWTSIDGAEWAATEAVDADFENAGLHDVAGFGGALLAIGVANADDGGRDFVPGMWFSEDGTSWQRVALDESVFGREALLGSLFPIGSRLMIVGQSGEYEEIWTARLP